MANDSQIADFLMELTGLGRTDLETAIDVIRGVGLSTDDLAEYTKEFAKSTGVQVQNVDVCAIAYDRILLMARATISRVLDLDIEDCNDDDGFCTSGNHYATTYDWSGRAHEQLKEALRNADGRQAKELRDDVFVMKFLEHADISAEDIGGIRNRESGGGDGDNVDDGQQKSEKRNDDKREVKPSS